MKKYPLFIIIILSILTVSLPGAIISIRDMNFTYPAAAVMIQTIKNGQLMRVIGASDPGGSDPGAVALAIKEAQDKQKGAGTDEKTEAASEDTSEAYTETESREDTEDASVSADAAKGNEDILEESDDESSEDDKEDGGDEDTDDEDGTEEATEADEADEDEDDGELKEFTTVSNNYFEDACFIGDSRVQGLGLYSDLPATNYGIVGMQLYRVFDKKVISTDMGKVTITDMLAGEPKYGKIYLGFGLNEMGWGNNDMFAEYYYGLIDYIKAVQPDAIIYVMGLIHVTEREEQSSSLYTNAKINERNELLREIAENEHVYYLDLNEVFTDENGRLASEDSFDGIHIKAGAIDKWAEYLRTHAIVD